MPLEAPVTIAIRRVFCMTVPVYDGRTIGHAKKGQTTLRRQGVQEIVHLPANHAGMFRRGFATLAHASGATLRDIQEQLRHASAATTAS
jgi:integrase